MIGTFSDSLYFCIYLKISIMELTRKIRRKGKKRGERETKREGKGRKGVKREGRRKEEKEELLRKQIGTTGCQLFFIDIPLRTLIVYYDFLDCRDFHLLQNLERVFILLFTKHLLHGDYVRLHARVRLI